MPNPQNRFTLNYRGGMTGAPSVIPREFPPVVYVPCLRDVADPADLEVLYRETKDGRTALLVYSALDRLRSCNGEDQPWFLIPTPGLQALYDNRPFDLVLLDILVPEHERLRAAS